jgi:hypothetical protein
MARSIWRFVAAEIFSGGGVLRISTTSLPPSRCSHLGGGAVRLDPVPEFECDGSGV